MNYRHAEEVRQTAIPLIEAHHGHLLGLRIETLFTDKTAKSKGREIPGRAKKVSGLPAFLASEFTAVSSDELPDYYLEGPLEFFVVEVSEDIWRELSERRRVALVDHLLSQCEIETDEETGDAKLSIVGPDVAEFSAVLMRHGPWTDELRDFAEIGAEQLSLIEDGLPVGRKLEAVR